MKGAINKFKIMPPIVMPKDNLLSIANYIYAGNIEKPEGFEQHVQEMHGKSMGMKKEKEAIHKMHNKSAHHKSKEMQQQMMQQLNLSPQQKQQVMPLMQEKKTLIYPLIKKMHQLSQTLIELDTTHADYQQKVTKLAKEKAKLVYRITLAKAEMKQKFEAMLTPEQQTKFRQLQGVKK